MSKINNVAYAQGFFGRIFGCVEILIESAAAFGVSSYSYIVNPEFAKAAIEQAIANQVTKVTIA